MDGTGGKSTDMDGGACIHFRIGGFPITLRSDLKQILQDFALIYPPQPGDTPASQDTVRIEVQRLGRSRLGRRLYRVYADGQEVGGWHPHNEVFPLVEWAINLRIIARRWEYLQFHAASMVLQGNGFIFAGESGCGKSTLAAILLARGWQYLCDEIALVHRETLKLHPFPKAICLKAGSQPLVRQMGFQLARSRSYVKQFKGHVGYVNPRDAGPAAVGEPAPVRYIVFPTYRGRTEPRLRPISRAEAAMSLFGCCFNRAAVGDRVLPMIQTLVKRAACFRLEVGDPAPTGRLLESSLGEMSATPADVAAWTTLVPPAGTSGKASVDRSASRREMLLVGARLAYIAPAMLTLTASQALAASSPSGVSAIPLAAGAPCETDSDCGGGKCTLGVCQ